MWIMYLNHKAILKLHQQLDLNKEVVVANLSKRGSISNSSSNMLNKIQVNIQQLHQWITPIKSQL